MLLLSLLLLTINIIRARGLPPVVAGALQAEVAGVGHRVPRRVPGGALEAGPGTNSNHTNSNNTKLIIIIMTIIITINIMIIIIITFLIIISNNSNGSQEKGNRAV